MKKAWGLSILLINKKSYIPGIVFKQAIPLVTPPKRHHKVTACKSLFQKAKLQLEKTVKFALLRVLCYRLAISLLKKDFVYFYHLIIPPCVFS